MITHEHLLESLRYEPDTGNFIWLKNICRVTAGSVAGSTDTNGYISIKLRQKKYLAHRLAWFYVHDRWPPNEIDHDNRVRNDNRLCNLRQATISQNRSNSSRNKTRLKGAYFNHKNGRKKWRAQITVDRKSHIIGTYETEIEAHQAYCAEAFRQRGEFFCNGSEPAIRLPTIPDSTYSPPSTSI